MIGVLLLAERAALAAEGYPQMPYPGAPYGGADPGVNPGGAQTTNPGTAIVPAQSDEPGNGPSGGQL
jgi:hypothetical protein